MSYRHEVAWRARQIANGLCVKCTKPATGGLRMCDDHQAWERGQNKIKYRRRVLKRQSA